MAAINPAEIIANVGKLREMIQNIRQKDGGLGSVEHELVLHRAIHDLEMLVTHIEDINRSNITTFQQLKEVIVKQDVEIEKLKNPESE